jgi:methionyl aminopeptidase
MIPIKSPYGIARMREACAVAASVLHEIRKLVAPGVTTYDLDQAARQIIAAHGAKSADYGYQIGDRRYPAYTCISVNDEVVHGIPSLKRVLRDGDIASLDVTVEYNGYIGDNALTVPVGQISQRDAALLRDTAAALRIGISKARPGARVGEISHAIQTHAKKCGYGIVRDLTGHGVGTSMHEPPNIPNYGRRSDGAKLLPGMTIAIEPMLNLGTGDVETLADGWTIVTADGQNSAHFEHTVLITETGSEILTIPPPSSL